MNRLFLALRARLYDYDKLQTEFSAFMEGSLVANENLHLTVCYFGDNYSVDKLLQTIPLVIKKLKPLPLVSLGFFKHNNILYAKVKSKELEELQDSICTSLLLQNREPFIPHVTLMRIKDIHNKKAFKQMLKKYKAKTLGIVDTKFELINSHLSPNAAKYESIKRFES